MQLRSVATTTHLQNTVVTWQNFVQFCCLIYGFDNFLRVIYVFMLILFHFIWEIYLFIYFMRIIKVEFTVLLVGNTKCVSNVAALNKVNLI